MTGALDMALDDMIVGSERGSKKGSGKGKSKTGWKGRGDESSGRGSGGGGGGATKEAKLDMSLDDVIHADGDSGGRKGSKGFSKGSWGSTGKGSWDDWSKGAMAKGSNGSWGSWGSSKGGGAGGGGGGEGGGGGGGGGGSGGDPPRWMEHDYWRGDAPDGEGSGRGGGGGGSKDAGWGSAGGWVGDWGREGFRGDHGGSTGNDRGSYSTRSSKDNGGSVRDNSPAWRRVEQPPERSYRSSGASGGSGVKRKEEGYSSRSVKRIKVTNVPRDLAEQDIKEAFEAEAGKTTSCELKRGIAYLTFVRHEDAKKAVETFDRGELNGKTITVALEP